MLVPSFNIIPVLFISAILSVIHSPVRWVGYDAITSSDYDTIGSSKNLRVYRTTGVSSLGSSFQPILSNSILIKSPLHF